MPVPVGSSPILGRTDAKVTIVEFSDFQCPFCARVQPVLEEVRKTYGDDVRIVYKHLPLSFHQHAEGAAQAAAAAAAQGKFWPMAEALFGHQSALSRAELPERARAAGLDVARFALALASGRLPPTCAPISSSRGRSRSTARRPSSSTARSSRAPSPSTPSSA